MSAGSDLSWAEVLELVEDICGEIAEAEEWVLKAAYDDKTYQEIIDTHQGCKCSYDKLNSSVAPRFFRKLNRDGKLESKAKKKNCIELLEKYRDTQTLLQSSTDTSLTTSPQEATSTENGAHYRGAGADLRGADLHHTQIDDATQIDDKWRLVWEIVNQGAESRDLRSADLRKANLRGANLRKANLRKVNLSGADLSGADLSEANLSEANLRKANLRKANLSEANLSEANLSKANLSKANLRGANLQFTNVQAAQFRSCIGLSEDTRRYLEQQGAICENAPARRIVSQFASVIGNSILLIARRIIIQVASAIKNLIMWIVSENARKILLYSAIAVTVCTFAIFAHALWDSIKPKVNSFPLDIESVKEVFRKIPRPNLSPPVNPPPRPPFRR